MYNLGDFHNTLCDLPGLSSQFKRHENVNITLRRPQLWSKTRSGAKSVSLRRVYWRFTTA